MTYHIIGWAIIASLLLGPIIGRVVLGDREEKRVVVAALLIFLFIVGYVGILALALHLIAV